VSSAGALHAAVSQARSGHALPRTLHVDPSIYDAELELIWRRCWLLAGLTAEARDPGDFRFDLAGSRC
jgi:phenylpropionate dioxygenase-like ring-hydroxylating dioxygenase large terminal subunit